MFERHKDTHLAKALLEQLGKCSLIPSNTSGKIPSMRVFPNNAQVSFRSKKLEAFFFFLESGRLEYDY